MLPLNLQDVVIAQSPSYAYGWQAILHVRIFIFIEKPSAFSIDFNTQNVAVNALYIVPPNHFHFISRSQQCKFWCIDIPIYKLSEYDTNIVTSLKFRPQKEIPLSGVLSQQINGFLEDKNNCVAGAIPLLQAIFASYRQSLNAEAFYIRLPLAKNLITLLWSRDEKLEHLTIKKVAAELFCCTKTLSRACKTVFGQSAQSVLQYQLLLASLFMLDHCKDIAAIAQELGFADKKGFIKFIKRKVNHSPKQISKLIDAAEPQ